MKITVQVEDFYFDEEDYSSLDAQLKKYVVQKVKEGIWEAIEKKVDEQITKTVKEVVTKNLNRKINREVKKLIESGKVKGYRSSELVSVQDYIIEAFEYSNSYNTIKDMVAKKADTHSSEMKSRYDLLFASQLVAKMNNQGLLKEGVFQTIMQKNP